MKNLLIICVVVLMYSCTQRMHKSGTYEVISMEKKYGAYEVHFKHVKGAYYLFSDTVKVNDKIFINVVTDTTGIGNKINIKKN